MRFFIWSILILYALAGVADPEAETGAAKKNYRIGVLFWSMNIPGQVAMRQGLEQEAKRINGLPGPSVEIVPLVAGDDQSGIERQIGQMEKMIEQRVDLIIVQPTDNAALTAPLKKANAAGIPVIAYDQYISGGKLVSYVTSDNYQAGYLGGEYLSSLFPENKKLSMVIVEYPYVSSTIERVDGFLDALGDCRRPYEIRKRYQAVEPESGRRAGEEILQDFPNPGMLDVVFTVNDGGGIAVFRELSKAGNAGIAGITIDGDPEAIAIIRAGGIIKNDSAQFCGTIGAVALRTAYDFLRGRKVPSHIVIPAFPVNRETVGAYHGWLAPIPGEFKKSWPSKKTVWNPQLQYEWKK